MYLFYNLGPGRSPIRLAQELRGMASMRPRVIGLCEAIGYPLPDLSGYTLIKGTVRPGRANIAAYVRKDLPLKWHRWHDLSQTWPRTERAGTHPARSLLELRVGPVQVLVHHQPPKTKHTDSWLGQREGIDLCTDLMRPKAWSPVSRKRSRILLWDANRLPGERGPGPDLLAERIGGKVLGDKIDGAVVRRLPVTRWLYRKHVPGTMLLSDHPWGAFQVVLP